MREEEPGVLLTELPEDALCSVLAWLEPRDLAAASLVCRRLSQVASQVRRPLPPAPPCTAAGRPQCAWRGAHSSPARPSCMPAGQTLAAPLPLLGAAAAFCRMAGQCRWVCERAFANSPAFLRHLVVPTAVPGAMVRRPVHVYGSSRAQDKPAYGLPGCRCWRAWGRGQLGCGTPRAMTVASSRAASCWWWSRRGAPSLAAWCRRRRRTGPASARTTSGRWVALRWAGPLAGKHLWLCCCCSPSPSHCSLTCLHCIAVVPCSWTSGSALMWGSMCGRPARLLRKPLPELALGDAVKHFAAGQVVW